MPADVFAAQASLFGTALPSVRNGTPPRKPGAPIAHACAMGWKCARRGPRLLPRQRPHFGDVALIAFLLAQCLDGAFTYMGVVAFGIGIEGNPVVAALMTHLGHGAGLLSAKLIAGALGICLHVLEIHAVVALLAGFYLTAAVAPWTFILFF